MSETLGSRRRDSNVTYTREEFSLTFLTFDIDSPTHHSSYLFLPFLPFTPQLTDTPFPLTDAPQITSDPLLHHLKDTDVMVENVEDDRLRYTVKWVRTSSACFRI